MNKYLFEFIGHILRKYNITKITITNNTKSDIINKYSSTDWKFKTINKCY